MIEFLALGGVDLRSSEGRAVRSVLAQPKRLALFAYLLLERPGTLHRRDTLVGIFWPELSDERARAALRKSLHYLRAALGDDVIIGQGEEAVGVAAERVRCDVFDFERELASGDLLRALEFYRGDLLAGLFISDAAAFEQWLEGRRWWLRDRAAVAAWEMAERELGASNPVGAAQWGRRAFVIQSHSEAALQRLIVLLDRLGDRAGALRTANEFLQELAAEELSPTPETVSLMAQVRARMAAPKSSETPSPSPPAESSSATSSPAIDVVSHDVVSGDPPPKTRARARTRLVRLGVVVLGLLAGIVWLRDLPVDASPTLRPAELRRGVAIVLADFASADSGLARAATEAVRVDVARSPVVRLVNAERVAQALTRMQRDPMAHVDATTALEVARREGFTAVITGSIEPAGRGYLLAVQLISAADGSLLASERFAAADSSGVLHAIDQLSKALRRAVGESAAQLRTEPPLEQVTTANLRALESFSLALRVVFAQGDFARAIALLENAIELDSTFAAAHTTLGVLLNSRGERTRAIAALTKGYALRQRLTERERLWLSAHYFRFAELNLERAAHAYESLLELEAKRAPGSDLHDLHAEYADVLLSLRQDQQAEQHARRAIEHDASWRWLGQRALTHALVYQNRIEEAAASLTGYLERMPNQPLAEFALGELAATRGDYDAARSVFERLHAQASSSRPRYELLRRVADTEAVRGRYERALQILSAASADAAAAGATGINQSIVEARYQTAGGRVERAQAILRRAASRDALARLPVLDRPYAAAIEALALAGAPAEARALLDDAAAAMTENRHAFEAGGLERARGAVALAERRFADAIVAYRRADAGRCRVCALPGLARAYELAGQADSAIAVYERYVTTPDIDRLALDALHLAATHERLARLYERRGDAARTSVQLERFVALWADADPELQPRVRQARQQLSQVARVGSTAGPRSRQ